MNAVPRKLFVGVNTRFVPLMNAVPFVGLKATIVNTSPSGSLSFTRTGIVTATFFGVLPLSFTAAGGRFVMEVITGPLMLFVKFGSEIEFVTLAKSRPGTLRFGSGGTGGITHLAGELFASLTGTQLSHVPYKAGALAMNALLGNEVQMNILNMLNAQPHIQSGRLRGLAVTGLKRSQFLPNLPTLDEAGAKGYQVEEFHSLALPAGTPRPLVMRLHGELTKALGTDELKQKLAQQAAEITPTSPEQFAAFLAAEQEKYAKIVKAIGLKPD